MAETHCGSCGVVIVWAETENGKRMPIDEHPVELGNLVLVLRGSRLIAIHYDEAKHRNWKRRVSHFVTCPQAKSWRTER